MIVDFEGIKRLPPGEQIKSLRLAIEELRKGISEREDEIGEAERLLALARRNSEAIEQAVIPKPTVTEQLRDVEPVTAPEQVEQKPALDESKELEEMIHDAPQKHEEQEAYETPDKSEVYGEPRPVYDDREEKSMYDSSDPRDNYQKEEKRKRTGDEEQAEHLKSSVEKMLDESYK